MRLFFDIFKQQTPSYDFQGRYFSRPEDAAQLAELIAADLGCSEDNDWVARKFRSGTRRAKCYSRFQSSPQLNGQLVPFEMISGLM